MKLKVGVFFGSRSLEHEISIVTAQETIKVLQQKYEVVPIYISKNGKFYTGDHLTNIENFKDETSLLKSCINLNFSLDNLRNSIYKNSSFIFMRKNLKDIDIAFPIIHGTYGEDGTIQGVFELMNIPYIGSNVLSSSLTMDKIFTKFILKANNYKIIKFEYINCYEFLTNKEEIIDRLEKNIDYPMILKPANLGSSIGIEIANDRSELEKGIESITFLSEKIIIEKFLEDVEELNISVMGYNETVDTSLIEKLIDRSKILTYEDKYTKGLAGAKRELPAKISDDLKIEIENQSKQIFKLFNCSGLVRMDFILDKKSNELYMNEVNSIPGSLSSYLWKNFTFIELIDRLINLSLKRKRNKDNIKYVFENNLLFSINGSKKLKGN